MTRRSTTAIAALLAGAGFAPVALAQGQDQSARIAALEARVAELEESRSAPLTFGSESGTEVEFYGYIKSDLIYDFDYELGNTTFGLVGIGPGLDDDAGAFTGTVNQTRLGFRTTTQTSLGELGTQVEIDFYGATGAFSDAGPEPRLRHATATLGGLRLGKYWTTFMPLSSYPLTLDFQGVVGIPFARQEQVRYTQEFGGSFSAEIALEDSNADADSPVLIGALAYDTDPLLLRGSIIGGRVEDGDGDEQGVWGVNLSTTTQLWEGATLDAAYTYGEGIASYLVFLGDDLDANGDPIEVQSAYAGLSQTVGEDWTFRAIYGWRENETGVDGSTEQLQSVHLNGEYQLTERMSFGVEYFHGMRDTFGGGSYDTNRIQTSFQVDF
ncbi:Porin subfamily protein [Roseivivax jejudonensis]|uniref:Porin subfamily protein n=1 Tax=Roseivivax jejudonensis TaxID=1529041 RepID=A0A1X7A204_9RHOB|nr:DcaP family trimeric outer membrane transporter [Roseivivax jejudonensis]SLN68228.1 Porin subfamily protein [Roseivivax jejudonensis]